MARRVLITPAARRGRAGRVKGANFEREVAERFREVGYPDARRGIGQARSSSEVPDVQGVDWWIEAKRRAGRVDLLAALAQAEAASTAASGPYLPPLVVAKSDGRPAVAVLYFEDLLVLLKEHLRLRAGKGRSYG